VLKVANEAVRRIGGESQGVAPEIPLEHNDREGHHANPEHGQGGLSPREAGVEETDTGHHDQDHARRDEDEGLVARREPHVEVLHRRITAIVAGSVVFVAHVGGLAAVSDRAV
jgi:hypothetical protein